MDIFEQKNNQLQYQLLTITEINHGTIATSNTLTSICTNIAIEAQREMKLRGNHSFCKKLRKYFNKVDHDGHGKGVGGPKRRSRVRSRATLKIENENKNETVNRNDGTAIGTCSQVTSMSNGVDHTLLGLVENQIMMI